MKKLLLAFTFLLGNLALAQDPKGAEALVDDGIILHDRGDFDGAIKLYDKALTLDEHNYLAMAEKAISLNAAGRHEEAIQLCKDIVSYHGDEQQLHNVYVTWGNSLDVLGKHDQSIEVYDEGISKFPDAYLLHFNKGITYISQENYEESIPFFQSSSKANPDHAGSHNAIGRLISKSNRVPALLALFRFFVIEPEGSRAQQNLAFMEQVLYGNVDQTGKNTITITIDGSILGDTLADGTNAPNNFSSTEFLLSLQCALVFDKENKKKNDAERLAIVIDGLCSSLSENQEENSGFYWDYYVPYFVEMQEKEFIEPLSYLVYASSGEKFVKKWFEENRLFLGEFYKWSDKFTWFKG
jgi:tetratricopeptide (TPR) repeat protein